MDVSPRLEGTDWQNWASHLLNAHYAKGDYQAVPDKDRGDAGIEGYSTDGCAYQMYGPEGDLTFPERHRKLRDKMTRDIGKFIANKDDKLSKIFGNTKIRRWILLVPSYDSREIVEHAAKKTEEVLNANLSYVDQDQFKVMVLDEKAFADVKAKLLSLNVAGIEINSAAVEDDDIDSWSADVSNASQAGALSAKTEKMPTLKEEANRRAFEREVIIWWLKGQNVLEELRAYPEAWEAIRQAKSEQERYLHGHSMVTDKKPYPFLQEALSKIEATVQVQVAALSTTTRIAVAHEAVADWLMRCPLNFPEVSSHE